MARTIEATTGQQIIVDDGDYEWLNSYNWSVPFQHGYPNAWIPEQKRGRQMHQLILGTLPGFDTDHINDNPLDNRRCNLRRCTHGQNVAKAPREGQAKGVDFNWRSQKYRARITKDGKTYSLGYFKTEVEAKLAYNEAALKLHGEFALLHNTG